ncbi:MAG: inositol monophosphatase family protein [Gammaproteobacteria bacterium]|nr:inositol monophosphatase family protein [Gammaproteobacteria bacterium]
MEPMAYIALRAARRAGRIILPAMDRVDTLTIEHKGKNDLVTEIDRQAEDAIVETILASYPGHAIVGEERGTRAAAGDSEDARYTWIIDPLDGTTNFLYGIPHFCTSIAVKRDGTLMHGVVVDHVHNEEFTASRGDGARLNGRRLLRVSGHRQLDEAVIGTGLVSERAPDRITAYGHMTGALNRECRTLRRQGAAALDLAWVAAGRLDGYFEFGLKTWDMAAAAVIVREAGGFVSDADGGDRFLETGNVVAANPRLIRHLLRSIRNGTEAALA